MHDFLVSNYTLEALFQKEDRNFDTVKPKTLSQVIHFMGRL